MTRRGTRIQAALVLLAVSAGASVSCCGRRACEQAVPPEIAEPVPAAVVAPRATLVGRVSGPQGPRTARIEVFRRRAFRPYVHGGSLRAGGRDREREAPRVGEPPVASADAGADGAFVIAGLELGAYDVRAEGGGDVAGAYVSFEVGGERKEAMLVLEPAVEHLAGRAVWSNGKPVEGVLRASTTPWDGDWKEPRSLASPLWSRTVATDSEGHFQFDRVPRRTVWLAAYVGGTWRWQGANVELPVPEPFVLTVGGAEARVEGTVLDRDTDRGIEGASVWYDGVGAGGWGWGKATTRTDGSFSGPWSGGGVFEVFVVAKGYAPMRRTAEGGPFALALPVTMRLARAGRIAGRVTDTAGQPVVGLPVLLESSLAEPVATGADGRYAFEDVPSGDWVVDARGNGWVPRALIPRDAFAWTHERTRFDPVAVTVRPGDAATFDLVVTQGAELRGIVLDAADRPVEGASVGIFASHDDPGFAWTGGEPGPSVATDAAGAFRIGGLVPGAAYEWHAAAPAFDDRRGDAVAERTPGSPVTIRLVAAPAQPTTVTAHPNVPPRSTAAAAPKRRDLHGRVSYADGRPTPDADVTLRASLESDRWEGREVTDEDGTFEVTAPDGVSLSARARKEDRDGDWEAAVTVPPGETTVAIPLRLKRTRAPNDWHVVRIVDGAGRLVPRVWMRVGLGLFGRGEATDLSGGVYELGWTPTPKEPLEVWGARDEQGVPLPLGPASFSAWDSVGSDVEIRLPPERSIGGSVRDLEGRGVGGVFVWVVPVADEHRPPPMYGGKFVGEARSGQDGRFRVRGLGEGEYLLRCDTPPGLFAPHRVVATGGTTGIDVRLHGPIDATLTVRTDAGDAVAGANVSASVTDWATDRVGWEERESSRGKAVTDAQGACVLKGLDPEEPLRLQVEPPARRRQELAGIDRKDWLPTAGPVVLARTGSLAGTVKDRAGRPVPDVNVIATQDDERRRSASTGADGTFQIDDLLLGPVTLTVAFPDGPAPGASPTSASVGPGGSTGVILAIDTGASLVVEVDRGAAPHDDRSARAILFAEGLEARELEGWERFSFQGLKADTPYTLWLAPTADGKTALLEGVRAAAEPLRVRPVQGKTINGRIRLPAGAVSELMSARRAGSPIKVYFQAVEDEAYVVPGLADGTWIVEAYASVGSHGIHARGEAAAGATLDLETWTPIETNHATK